MRKKAMLKRTVAFAAAFSMTLSMGGFAALAATDAKTETLTITDVTCANGNTSTGQASTVQSVTYTLDGEEKTASVATSDDTRALTLVIDNEEYEIKEGASYTVDDSYEFVDTKVVKTGGPSAAPWSGASDDEKSLYYFRQALYLYDGEIQEDSSVTDLIQGGSYDSESAKGVTVTSNGAHFNGIYVSGDSEYSISESELYATGDGGDDFSGWGAALMTDENAVVTVDDSYIETSGTIRTAIWAGGSSKITVNNSLIYAQETQDDYDTYTALVPAMMKRVPFALGMEGTIRATNVLGAGQAIYNDSMIVSTGWGALSTDSGQAYSTTGTYALTVNNSIGGIGTVEEYNAAKNYTATFEVNGTKYGFTVGGSGYVTYADSGVWNKYTGVKFYSPDYVQIMASGQASSEYYDSYMYSERIAFMTQQAGGGTLTLTNSEVETQDALMQIKSGAANKGYTNLVVDNTDVNFSGDSVRTEDGILVELVESDDAGNPGVTTYTINDVGDTAEPTADEITDSTATFKNGDYTGDIWNSIYNYKQALVVTLENANLTGTVSSSVAVHVDPETGDVVENGTVLEAYTGSETEDIANYLADKGGTTGDYLTVGSFQHEASEMVNNPIDLTIDADSTWTVTSDSYLNTLTVDSLEDITAEEAVTVYTTELTVGDETYDYGTYTEGNVTYEVAENTNVAEDTGIAAAGQTYANVPYTFYVVNEDGSYNSKAVTVTTQNWTDGNVYYNLVEADGYEIADVAAENGTIAEVTEDADTEMQQYAYVLTPAADAQSMVVTITVKEAGSGQTLKIEKVTCANGNTTTGQASTVQSVTYTLDGVEGTASVVESEDTHALTLVIDGEEYEIAEGATYTVNESFEFADSKVYVQGGPSAAPWSGASDDEKSVYYFRQALYLLDGEIQEDASVTDLIQGGSYDSESAEGVTVTSNGPHFNGIYVSGTSTYSISESELYATGDGGDDFSGWGAALMIDSNANVTVDNSYIETSGTIRTAIWAGGNSIITVNNSLIYAQETQDDYATYTALVPAMMKRVPFALGMEGTIRATNVLGAGQAIYNNSMIVSTGWGALSTDSGQAYSQTGTYALTVTNSIGGIGTVEEFQAGKNYTATFELNGVTYGFTVGGSGYVTYADSGVWNKYTGVQFYSPDYVQIMASGEASSEYYDSYMYSERIAFMTQQAGGGTLTLTNSEVDTQDALMQIKSGAANKGYTNLVVDNTDVDFSGDSVRTEDGILVELVESDDAGNPGVTTYTINDVGDTAEPTADEITDSTATFKNGDYTGDIWNSIYNYKQALVVTLENANLTGTVSSSVAVHVDPETGDVVENGTVLEAYTGSESADIANYLSSEGGTTGDYLTVGSFKHEASEMVNNPIDLTIDADSTWTVTSDSYLNTLTVDSLEDITAGEAVTVYTTELTVGDETYDYGTYTEGNVTYVVAENTNVAEDTGIAAAGQTYANVPYTFYSEEEDGTYNSKAVTVTTQNWTDGNVYFNLSAAEGYDVVDIAVEGGTIEKVSADADSEVQQYEYVLIPAESAESMVVTITVKAQGGDTSDEYTLDVVSSLALIVGESKALNPTLTKNVIESTDSTAAGTDDTMDLATVLTESSTSVTLEAASDTSDTTDTVDPGMSDVEDSTNSGTNDTMAPSDMTADPTVGEDGMGEAATGDIFEATVNGSTIVLTFNGFSMDGFTYKVTDAEGNVIENGSGTAEGGSTVEIANCADGSYTIYAECTTPEPWENLDKENKEKEVVVGGSDTEEPTTPDVEEPTTPDVEEPTTPDTEEPTTPDTEEPATPAEEIRFAYTSADAGIASVDENGVVTGVAVGKTVVTVDAYVNGEKVASADVDVTVTDESEPTEPGTTDEPTNPTEPGTTDEPTNPTEPGTTDEPTNPTDNNTTNTDDTNNTTNNTNTTTTAKSAKTGDANQVAGWIVLFAVAGGAVVVITRKKRLS